MHTNQNHQEKTLEQPTDIYTISYEEADSIGAEYITQSELEAMGLSVGGIEQGDFDE